MRAAIANKPNEAFPTANAPKKTLDVPISKPDDAEKPLEPKASDDADPDAPAGDGVTPKAVAPAAAPVSAPAKAVKKPMEPAKPAGDEHFGTANPPPDTN